MILKIQNFDRILTYKFKMFTFKIQKMTNFDHNNPKLIHFYLKIQNFDKFLTNCDLKNPKLIHFDLKNPKF